MIICYSSGVTPSYMVTMFYFVKSIFSSLTYIWYFILDWEFCFYMVCTFFAENDHTLVVDEWLISGIWILIRRFFLLWCSFLFLFEDCFHHYADNFFHCWIGGQFLRLLCIWSLMGRTWVLFDSWSLEFK